MMKKRFIISLIGFALVFVVAFLLNPLSSKEINIKYSLTYNKDEANQLFYSDNLNSYNDQNSQFYAIKAKEKININQDFPSVYHIVRMDFGASDNKVILENLSIGKYFFKYDIDKNYLVAQNDINEIKSSNNTYELQVQANDPFVVFDITSFLSELKYKINIFSYLLYFLIALTIGALIFIKYNMFKGILIWIKDIIRHRELIVKLSINDFKIRYAASYLGAIWAFVQPIVTVTIYVFVFGYGFKSTPVSDTPFVLWLVAGIVPWFFFLEALMSATTSLMDYSYLVKKVVFKISILPIVKITAALFVHLFFIVITILLYLLNGYKISPYYLQIIYYCFFTIVLTLGLSYGTAAVTVFFKDLSQIVNILLQFGMWLTPIMWDYNLFGPKVAKIMKFNPMFYVVDGYRDCFFGNVWFWEKPGQTVWFWFVSLVIFIVGAFTFKRLEKHFADVL